MQKKLTVLMAQINPTIGDVISNRDKIIEIIQKQQATHDLIIFPEMALTGYPPEDLLFRKEFQQAVIDGLKQIQPATKECFVLIGHPSLEKENRYNAVSVFHQSQKISEYHKQKLPNYEIFDEARYFIPGKKILVP